MENLINQIFILSIVIFSANQRPMLQTQDIDSSTVNYLKKLGYLTTAKSEQSVQPYLTDQEILITAVKQFQTFGGVSETGILDEDTLELMRTPRCGLPDVKVKDGPARMKRFAVQGSRWKKKELTFTVGRYPSGLSRSEVDTDVEKAFNMWQQASGLTFVRKRSWDKVDIEIRFENYYHGDEDAFDGPGGKTRST